MSSNNTRAHLRRRGLFESGVHGSQEGGWCSREAEGHDLVLVVPFQSLEGCFEFIASCHTNLVITSSEIGFRKP